MTTEEQLFNEYKTALIPLEGIAERLLGLNPKNARRYWMEGRLPLPITQLYESKGAPLFVHVKDLATYIDKQRAKERQALERAQARLQEFEEIDAFGSTRKLGMNGIFQTLCDNLFKSSPIMPARRR